MESDLTIVETGFEIRLCDHLEAQLGNGASMDAIRTSFFRPRGWRRDRARGRAASGRRPSPRHDDAATRLAVRYFRAVRTSPGRVRARGLDGVRRAGELAASDGPVRLELDARILARQSDAEIAARLPIPERVVGLYEGLHFAVRDRLRFPGWVICRVIGHGGRLGFGDDTRALTLSFAFHGGPLVLDAVLAATVPGRWPVGGVWSEADPTEVARVVGLARDCIAVARLPADTPLDKLVLVLEEIRAGPRRGQARPTNRRTRRTAPAAGGGRDRDWSQRVVSTLQQGILSLGGAT
jgi:hypothetical protein